MESKQFMVGDLVYRKEHNEFRKPVPRSVVKIDGVMNNNMITIAPDSEFLDMDEIEPILLTEEILAKNDFESQGNSSYRYFKAYDDSYYTVFESAWYYFDRKELKVTKEHRNGIQEYVKKFNVRYVHELQHALRLVGLNEVADNLKV